jgi:hypothetical protein
MYRCGLLTLAVSLVALGWQPPPARAAEGGELVGTWEGTSGAGGFQEIWTIKTNKGEWSVNGVFKKGGKEAGAFHGKDYKYANGTLTFVQEYDKKPVDSWSDGNEMAVKASGDLLAVTWRNGGQSGTTSLTRAVGDLIAGTWEGTSGAGGFKEVWTIKSEGGEWSVAGVFQKDGQEAGAFHGKDCRYANGTLTFVQEYDKKPDPTWASGTRIAARATRDKLVFTWRNANRQTGTVTMDRAK